jgi:hypothetical protein
MIDMNIKKYLPIIYFAMGIVFVVAAFYLSLQSAGGRVGGDIGADGGALGFAILSGICFLCSTYLTSVKKD